MQEYVSDYIGLPLLTRGGERIGYVKNVQTDRNLTRVRNLECCDEEDEEFVLPVSAAASFGEGAIVVKSPAAKGCVNCLPAPIGKEAFSTEGAQLGRVRDFGREGAEIRTLVLSDGREIPSERIAGVTDTVLIDLSENFVPRPVARRRRAKQGSAAPDAAQNSAKTPEYSAAEAPPAGLPAAADGAKRETAAPQDHDGETETYVRAAFAPAEDAEEDAADAENAENADAENSSAAHGVRRAGRGLLTGKILPGDLLDARGNVLARAGAEVNAEMIRRAMRHGKLFELTLLCCSASPYGIWR